MKVVAGTCEKPLQLSRHKGLPEQQKRREIKARTGHWSFHLSWEFMGNRLSVCVDHADGGLTVAALFWSHSFRLVMGEHHVLPVSVSTGQLRFFHFCWLSSAPSGYCPATQASRIASKGCDSARAMTGQILNSPLSHGEIVKSAYIFGEISSKLCWCVVIDAVFVLFGTDLLIVSLTHRQTPQIYVL